MSSAIGWLQSNLGLDITGEWDRIVTLNVGGVSYTCRRRTFREWQGSQFCKMVLADNALKAEDGSYVIDRDGATFRHVLNFLRTKKLILPDDFAEWDLLLDDAAAYDLPQLRAAVEDSAAYRRRSFRRALPRAVYLRWDDRRAEGEEPRAQVVLHPPLPLLSATSDGGLQHHGRRVASIDEAVTVLIGEYGMRLQEWSRDAAVGSGQGVMHSVFFSSTTAV